MEFMVNEYITLKLESDKTVMYVNGEEYDLCCGVLVNIPGDPPSISIENQVSIDSIIESNQYISTSDNLIRKKITPEEEFWAFCSNLQVWVENNYNTDLLDYNVSIPLLSRLIDVGDSTAEGVFKREILRRLKHGNRWDYRFIMSEGYFAQANVMEEEVIEGTLNLVEAQALKNIRQRTDLEYLLGESFDNIEIRERPVYKELNLPALFFTVNKGHIVGLEIELSKEHPNIPEELQFFTHLRELHIWVTDLDMKIKQPSFKINSVTGVKVITHNSVYYPRFLELIFPNVETHIVYKGHYSVKPSKKRSPMNNFK